MGWVGGVGGVGEAVLCGSLWLAHTIIMMGFQWKQTKHVFPLSEVCFVNSESLMSKQESHDASYYYSTQGRQMQLTVL